jgi:hypothetical protein
VLLLLLLALLLLLELLLALLLLLLRVWVEYLHRLHMLPSVCGVTCPYSSIVLRRAFGVHQGGVQFRAWGCVEVWG